MDSYRISWIFMDFHGFERFWEQNVGPPVPPCRNGLDPPNIKISDSGGLDLETWCLDVRMLVGLEWIGGGGGGDGGMGGGDPRTSHTLELEELGRLAGS